MFYVFELINPATNPPRSYRPLFLERVACGFPSPCQDYAEQELDLNEHLITHRASTFFLRAEGSSMQDIGLYDGDLLIVDRSLKPEHSDIVIAEVYGEFTVKRLLITPDGPVLQPMNPAYPVIKPDPDSLQIFGVVIHFVHTTRRRN
jgi:DNA polymerase V